jgi:hypothetical protein
MSQKDEDQALPAPLPVEPGHVMSREQYQKLVEQQQK